MRKTILMVVALLVLCTGLAQAQVHAFDPTDAQQVQQQAEQGRQFQLWLAANKGLDDFQKPWDARLDDDGGCWAYTETSNYAWGEVCSFSPTNSCLDNCLRIEANCTENCSDVYGSSGCGTNGTPCETCQDQCRSNFNSCKNNC